MTETKPRTGIHHAATSISQNILVAADKEWIQRAYDHSKAQREHLISQRIMEAISDGRKYAVRYLPEEKRMVAFTEETRSAVLVALLNCEDAEVGEFAVTPPTFVEKDWDTFVWPGPNVIRQFKRSKGMWLRVA